MGASDAFLGIDLRGAKVFASPRLKQKLGMNAVAAVGVASAGAIEVRTGTLVYAPQLPTMSNTPLVSMLNQRIGTPAIVGNDANLAVMASRADRCAFEISN